MGLGMESVFPFPHSEIGGVFEDFAWEEFSRRWPSEVFFSPYSDGKDRELGESGRFGFYILGYASRNSIGKLNPSDATYWRKFVQDELKPKIYSEYLQYLPYIRARFENDLSKIDLQIFGVLVNCYNKLEVRIHTENPSSILTGLIYRDPTNDMSVGTSIYTPKEKNYVHGGVGFLSFNDFDLCKTANYSNNSMFTFLKTDNSFHGVPETTLSNPEQRSTLNWHLRMSDETIKERYGKDSFWDFSDAADEGTQKFHRDIARWRDSNLLQTHDITPLEKQKFDEMFDRAV